MPHFTRHRQPRQPAARWKPQAGRPRAHMNLTQVLRAKAFEIILLDSRRISVKDGPVNRAATETISPVSSRAPRLLVTSPSRVIFGPSTAAMAPRGSSPSSHRPSLPAISHLPRPLARQYGALLCQSGLPIPHRRLLLLPCRLERGRRRLEGGGGGRLQRLLREPLLPLDGYLCTIRGPSRLSPPATGRTARTCEGWYSAVS